MESKGGIDHTYTHGREAVLTRLGEIESEPKHRVVLIGSRAVMQWFAMRDLFRGGPRALDTRGEQQALIDHVESYARDVASGGSALFSRTRQLLQRFGPGAEDNEVACTTADSECQDYDLIANSEHAAKLLAKTNFTDVKLRETVLDGKHIDACVTIDGSFCGPYDKSSKRVHLDIEIILHARSSADILSKLLHEEKRPTFNYTSFIGCALVPSVDMLALTKRAHLHCAVNWFKHLDDYLALRRGWARCVESQCYMRRSSFKPSPVCIAQQYVVERFIESTNLHLSGTRLHRAVAHGVRMGFNMSLGVDITWSPCSPSQGLIGKVLEECGTDDTCFLASDVLKERRSFMPGEAHQIDMREVVRAAFRNRSDITVQQLRLEDGTMSRSKFVKTNARERLQLILEEAYAQALCGIFSRTAETLESVSQLPSPSNVSASEAHSLVSLDLLKCEVKLALKDMATSGDARAMWFADDIIDGYSMLSSMLDSSVAELQEHLVRGSSSDHLNAPELGKDELLKDGLAGLLSFELVTRVFSFLVHDAATLDSCGEVSRSWYGLLGGTGSSALWRELYGCRWSDVDFSISTDWRAAFRYRAYVCERDTPRRIEWRSGGCWVPRAIQLHDTAVRRNFVASLSPLGEVVVRKFHQELVDAAKELRKRLVVSSVEQWGTNNKRADRGCLVYRVIAHQVCEDLRVWRWEICAMLLEADYESGDSKIWGRKKEEWLIVRLAQSWAPRNELPCQKDSHSLEVEFHDDTRFLSTVVLPDGSSQYLGTIFLFVLRLLPDRVVHRLTRGMLKGG